MKKETRAKLFFIAFWIFMVTSFTALAFFVLTEATGYRFDWKTWHMEMTGLISIDGTPKAAVINVNGKIYPDQLPFRLTKIFPGQYEVTLSMTGYSDWSKIYNVAGGQAYEDKKIIIFFSNPEIKEINVNKEQVLSDYKNRSDKITLNDNEIWYKDELVSRFSGKIFGVQLSDDKKHIFFQLNNELRVIELDGKNNTKLITLPTKEEVVFAVSNDEKILYLFDDKVFETRIR